MIISLQDITNLLILYPYNGILEREIIIEQWIFKKLTTLPFKGFGANKSKSKNSRSSSR